MILEMKVPSPGESISEVEIAEWLVSDGDYVEKDQTIAEVDSDKATLELPAEESGIITLKAEEGDAIAVGAVVCHIDTCCCKASRTGCKIGPSQSAYFTEYCNSRPFSNKLCYWNSFTSSTKNYC